MFRIQAQTRKRKNQRKRKKVYEIYTKRKQSDIMRIAIVTGASSGLGQEFVRQLEDASFELDEIWVIARRKERLCQLREKSRIKVNVIEGDLLQTDFFEMFSKILEEQTPDLRILVNAAGFGKQGKVKDISVKNQCDMVRLNCEALTHMTTMCIPYMKKGAHIINVASAAAFCPQPEFSVYAASKAYVLSFSRSLNAELHAYGIYVTAVCPGPVDTEFFEVSGKLKQGSMKERVMESPSRVVKTALQDSRKQKEISICGIPMKITHLITKILPQRMLLKAFVRKQ